MVAIERATMERWILKDMSQPETVVHRWKRPSPFLSPAGLSRPALPYT